MNKKIKTLLFSTLFPSSARPVHGIFVEARLANLLKSGFIETQVVAPVPWFPFTHSSFGSYAVIASTPKFEERNDIKVHHPRYFLPPKVGQNIAPLVLAAGALPTIKKIINEGFDFDLIDAHFFYPDGVAASIISKIVKKPFVCTARGSDITLYKNFSIPKKYLKYALENSSANIGVCNDLVRQMIKLGAPSDHSLTIRNGVDLQRFTPLDKSSARKSLGISEDHLLLLSVGHLVERKGHHLVIEMLTRLPSAFLLIVGVGPMEMELRQLAQKLEVQSRVYFAGLQPNTALASYYSAADVLILASSFEGWANVLLESMACGTPVVATPVNGTPEVVSAPEAGRLAASRNVNDLCEALMDLLKEYPSRQIVRKFAEGFSWDETTKLQCELFSMISGKALT